MQLGLSVSKVFMFNAKSWTIDHVNSVL